MDPAKGLALRAIVSQPWQQVLLIVSHLLFCWWAMMAVHEAGHVLTAVLTGGQVQHVELHPLAISRTDVAPNPMPLAVVWAGPVFGVVLPLVIWLITSAARIKSRFLARSFAAFCLVANGAYIGVGQFDGIGDAGQMMKHGSPDWMLWLFGIVCVPAGLALWHRQGPHFGFGDARGEVDPGTLTASVSLMTLALFGIWVFSYFE
ncbi:MAG: hypothetical protein Fues2KO_14010 [Fuerstiella sp.]